MSRYLGPQRCGEETENSQTARYNTIVGHNFSQGTPTKEKKKKSGLGINKHHDKDIIIPFKSIISDGCEVAAVK